MKVPFYGHVRQYHNIKAEIDANIQEVLESGQYVMGPMLKQFEAELAAYHGTKYAIGVGNGTDAIWLALMALGIGPGDEVITHPNTFFATAEAIWIAGATAVFVDCDPKTKCIDPTKIEAAITPKTKAIIPVHLYGQCADMAAIKQDRRQAQARASSRTTPRPSARAGRDFKIGELSDAATTSFIIQKNLGTFGDGGALVTNNADIDAKVRKLRNHGSTARNVHSYGFNSRLDDLHAGILSAKLKHIDAVERPAPQVGRPLHRRPARAARPSTCPSNCPATATSSTSTSSRPRSPSGATSWWISWSRTASTPRRHYSIAIHKQAGYPWGKRRPHRRPRGQRRAQRRHLRQPADVPRTDRGGGRLRHRQGARNGTRRNALNRDNGVLERWSDRRLCSDTPVSFLHCYHHSNARFIMSKYSVLVVGMGKRGMHHATAFNANPRFQVAGICDIDPKRLDDAAAKLGNPQDRHRRRRAGQEPSSRTSSASARCRTCARR